MKHYKRVWALVLTAALIINMFNIALAANDISLYIDGEKIGAEYKPILVDGRTIAPIRVISEKLGSEVAWNGENRTVTIYNGSSNIVLTIDKQNATRDGQAFTLDVPPKIIDGRTYVPLRFVSEVLGYGVVWKGSEKRVDVNSPSSSITEILAARIEDKQAVLLKIEGEYTYSTLSLTAPNRFVVDFKGTKLATDTDKISVESDLFTQVRTSQLSFNPLVSRIVLDCTDKESVPKIETVTGGYLAVYMAPKDEEPVDPVDPVDPNPVDPEPVDPVEITRETLQINAPGINDYKISSIFQEPNEPVYGTISSARVNLRTEPSTADSDTVRATVDGGTKLQVVGQTFGWYNVVYKNEELWVADWLLTLDLEMKRNNVNVRSGPGTTFTAIDTVLRGERIKVLERKPDWLKVQTESGKEGYIAEWLVGINDRLVEGDSNSEDVAKELTFTLPNININKVTFGERPSMVESISKKTTGNNVEVKVVLTEPIGFTTQKNDKGVEVQFGSALTSMEVTEAEGRVTIDLTFDLPVKFTVYQNFLDSNLLLDFPFSQAAKEESQELNNTIAKSIEIANKNESSQLTVQLNNLGSYKVNATGYSKNVQLVLLNSSLSGKIIALDPGHGGTDSGATKAGVMEKTLNLAVAKKVRDLLQAKGVTVIMTRDNDQKVSLSERVDYVNGLNADIAISIHTNSVDYGQGSGVETIYYSKPENERLARALQDGLVTATGFRSRGIKPWNWIYVTKNWNMPSALVEMGFITNPEERAYLNSSKGQQAIAENIVSAIERFFMYR